MTTWCSRTCDAADDHADDNDPEEGGGAVPHVRQRVQRVVRRPKVTPCIYNQVISITRMFVRYYMYILDTFSCLYQSIFVVFLPCPNSHCH